MMNIGFDAKRLFNNFTGLGNYSRTLLANLAEFFPEHTYHLYSPKTKENPTTQPFLSAPFKPFSPQNTRPLWRSYFLTNQLLQDKIDLFHGLSHELPQNISNKNIKSVVTIHDLIFKKYPQTYPWIDRQVYDFKFKSACQRADRVIAISQNTKQDIINYYQITPSKIDVIYQSCDPLYYDNSQKISQSTLQQKYQLPSEYLLFVGSVETRKNLKTLILAYGQLPKDLKIPLVIVGRIRQSKEILGLIQKHRLEENILWLENVQNNLHLQAIYQYATVLAYPSFYEGFGLPVVEALLSKTPVITSNVSSLPEAGGHHSRYFDPNNSNDLAQAIRDVLTDTTLRQHMIDQGYQYAHETFGRKAVTTQLMNLYQTL